MPISKNGVKYYTQEQLECARNASALEYALAHNYDLVRQGSRYILREHDSMVFRADGRWSWNSRDIGGRALDLLVHYEGLSIVDAVLCLAGDGGQASRPRAAPPPAPLPPPAQFILPARSPTQKHLFAYLCGHRKLDADIVRDLIHQRRIYESIHHYQRHHDTTWRECYNVVFLGLGSDGTPKNAYQRGASSKSTFKSEVPGGQKIENPFIVPGLPGISDVGFFEAAIDAIAHATLYKSHGVDYTLMERVAMGGIAADTAAVYLATHPEKKDIHLCLDADAPGIAGAMHIEEELRKRGYDQSAGYRYTTEAVPAGKKDWNEYLMATAPH